MQLISDFSTSNGIAILSKAAKIHVHNIRFTLMPTLYGYKILFLTLSQNRLRVFGNRVMRNVLANRRENVARS